MRKVIVFGIAIAAFGMPALAASAYYVVKDPKTNQCTVDTNKPDGKTKLAMNTIPYKTSKEATAAMKADPNCAH